MVPRKEYPSTIISATPLSNSAPATMRGGRSGAHSLVSFAIEPIQLPIVPLSLFSPQSLRTTAARERGADRSRRWAVAAAAQRGAQQLEVRELAELRRQRAVEVIRIQVPARAPQCCASTAW
jgi:hypothetical protein